MITDQSRASFQSQPALKMQLARPNPSATKQSEPVTPSATKQSEPVAPPCFTVPCAPCFGQTAPPQNDEIAKLQQQVSQLTAVVSQLAAMQQAQAVQQSQVQQQSPVQPAGYQTGSMRPVYEPQRTVPAAPSPAEQQYLAQYEQKCRELAGLQEQLAATQWEYQALLEAKQQKIIQDRDARMRRQLGEATEAAEDRSVPFKPASASLNASPPRSAPTRPANTAGREPLRLRGQSPVVDVRATLAAAPEVPTAPEGNSVSVDRHEDAQDSPAPTGSRFGRWLKQSK
jgi:hypothetical protein